MTFKQILQAISQKQFAPVYYLHGEETYFIDKLTQALSEGVVSPAEAAFNKSVFYGPDTNASQIITACRSFPVMATHRLTIVKEAQRLSKQELEKLAAYVEQPVPSTVLVLAFKGRNAGLPKKAATAAAKHGVAFHAKKMYERDVLHWLEGYLQESELETEPGIAPILVANLGLNIPLIENELEKMFIYLKATRQKRLTKDFVYEMINVDKEFNVFELIHALSEKQNFRAHLIIDRLTQNSKLNPGILIISNLFRFFHNIALVHSLRLRDVNAIKNQLNVHYYAAKEYSAASRRYSLAATYRNIRHIQQVDLMLKGMIPTHMSERHILKTLVFQLLQ